MHSAIPSFKGMFQVEYVNILHFVILLILMHGKSGLYLG